MTTKPTTLPEWATGGSALIDEPSLGEKQLGWEQGKRPPPHWMNWLQKNQYDWHKYVNYEPWKVLAAGNLTESSNPKAFALRSVAYRPATGYWVAVGAADGTDAYTLERSLQQSGSWNEKSNAKNIQLNAVLDCGGTLVAVGDADGSDAYILTSSHPVAWGEQSNAKNFGLNGLAFDGTTAVAVGAADGTDAYIVTATGAMSTWTERGNPKNFDLYDAAYSPSLGLWVAVGAADGTDAYIITASDPTSTWTEQGNPQNVALYGVTWDPVMELFIAVGATVGSIPYVITSPDGSNWTQQSPSFENLALNAVASDGSGLVMAVGNKPGSGVDEAFCVATFNGADWFKVHSRKSLHARGIAYGDRWVIVGDADGSDGMILESLLSPIEL